MAYFSAKDGKVNPRVKKFVLLAVKRNMKGYKLWDPENKKIVLRKHATFDETSLLKSIISQQVERMKTKDASQQVEVDITAPSPVDLVSVEISPDVIPGGDRVAVMDTEQVELIEVKRTKKNSRNWLKKRESQISELNLKAVILHDSIGKEIHMTQLVEFVAADSISVG